MPSVEGETPQSCQQSTSAKNNCLRILYYNARSLVPKYEELCAIAEAEAPDIICIVETWLSSEIDDSELSIGNYQILRNDRNRHGGGVLMYVSSRLSVKLLPCGCNSDLELLVISVSHVSNKCKYCVGLFYRPPSSNVDIFDRLCTALYTLKPSLFDLFVLIGDFNVNYFLTQSSLYRHLEYCLSSFSFHQIVKSVTHVSPSGLSSLIDLVFLSDLSRLRSCNVVPPLANSDHNGLQVKVMFSNSSINSKPPQLRTVWNYAQANFD